MKNLITKALRLLDDLAARMNRWARDRHRPFDIAGDGTVPAVCPRCKVDWPCDEFVRLSDRALVRWPG